MDGLKEVTTIVTRNGTFCFKKMPFGLINDLSTFQRVMDVIFVGLQFVIVHLDAVIEDSASMEEHIEHLWIVFDLIPTHKLKLKVSSS